MQNAYACDDCARLSAGSCWRHANITTYPSHEHVWVAVGTERNFGGGVGWVIQSCTCGEVRRVALPKDYPGYEEPQP